jgi:hypothetical protein
MDTEKATFESVWAMIYETQKMQQETDRLIKEMRENHVETERVIKESLKDLDAKIGRWSTNHGFFAEEYFINSFTRGNKNFFGEKFDKIITNAPGIKVDAEYDIVLLNGKSVAIIEVKFKAHENDIPNVIKKAETFRINYSEFAKHKIYLGLASMSFYKKLEKECTENGVAIIKQVGDTMVINDQHLKIY